MLPGVPPDCLTQYEHSVCVTLIQINATHINYSAGRA
jgi:hypothetical protein